MKKLLALEPIPRPCPYLDPVRFSKHDSFSWDVTPVNKLISKARHPRIPTHLLRSKSKSTDTFGNPYLPSLHLLRKRRRITFPGTSFRGFLRIQRSLPLIHYSPCRGRRAIWKPGSPSVSIARTQRQGLLLAARVEVFSDGRQEKEPGKIESR